ncbi:MAG: hypothetical protein FAF03_00970 [Epsilonproteobacteria bacterium]|nr:hypothetical protein [Campylobacterota bacterium]
MKKVILISLIAAPFLIVGCGGGSSTSTSTNAKITGTVLGTLIEAFCDNNYYAQVTSTNNGTNQHPFEIEVPKNTNCILVMTTNENDPANRVITEIAFSNGSTIVLNADVDLGNIPLELSYQNADDRDGDHVVDTPLQVNPNGAASNNAPVQDADGNGMIDAYDDDDDHDNTPNAYEDDDRDDTPNLHDDSDANGEPDYMKGNEHDGNDNNDDSMNDNSDDVDSDRGMDGDDNENENENDDTNG